SSKHNKGERYRRRSKLSSSSTSLASPSPSPSASFPSSPLSFPLPLNLAVTPTPAAPPPSNEVSQQIQIDALDQSTRINENGEPPERSLVMEAEILASSLNSSTPIEIKVPKQDSPSQLHLRSNSFGGHQQQRLIRNRIRVRSSGSELGIPEYQSSSSNSA